MKRISQIGLALACAALAAPAVAHADSVSVMSSVYEASFFSAGAEHEEATEHTQSSVFSLCRRCSAPDASPFLVNANLSALPSHDEGLNVVFNGGFSATFGGVMTLPVPAMSSGTSSSSNTPTITLPITPASNNDPAPTGGGSSSSGLGTSLHNTASGPVNTLSGTVTTTSHTALAKTESLAATPEPATLLLLGIGLISIAGGTAFRQRA